MARKRRAVIWLTGVLLFFPGPGGKVEAALTLNYSLSVSESYNDNLFFTEEDREADYTTSAGPFFKLTYAGKYFALSGNYRGAVQFHAKNSDADGYAQSASFDLDFPFLSRQIKGFEIKVTEQMSYTPVLPAFTFADEGEVLRLEGPDAGDLDRTLDLNLAKTDTFKNRAGVDVQYAVFERWTTGLTYQNIITRFIGSDFPDTVVHKAGFEETYTYQSSPRTTWTGSYDFLMTFYEEDDDVVLHELGIQLGHRITRLLSAFGGLGVAVAHGESPRFTLETGMSRQYKKGRVSLQYSGNIETGEGLIREGTYRQRVIALTSWTFRENLASYISFEYGNRRSLSGGNIEVSTYTGTTGIEIGLFPWLSASLGYSYFNQQSTGAIGGDGERNLVVFSLTASGPAWRVLN